MDVNDSLKELEEEFFSVKRRFEQYYLITVFLVLVPLTIIVVYFSKVHPDLFLKLSVRIPLFMVILFFLVMHYTVKYTFFKTNKYYTSVINNKLSELSKKYRGDNFYKEILELLSDNNYSGNIVFIKNVEKIIKLYSNDFQM